MKRLIKNIIKESDDFKWMEDSNPTLMDYFNSGLISSGDILVLSGKFVGEPNHDSTGSIEVDDLTIEITYSPKLMKGVEGKYYMEKSLFSIIKDKDYYYNLFDFTDDDLSFTKYDADLIVLSHTKKDDNLNESDELGWIRDFKPTLKNKVIHFEPMLNYDEWNKVLNGFLMGYDGLRWWSELSLSERNPIEEGGYVHHLIISNDNRMVFGGLDGYVADDYRVNGLSEYDIVNGYEDLYSDIDIFIEEHSNEFDIHIETIGGRKFFNIPYKGPITESGEDDFDWIRSTNLDTFRPEAGQRILIKNIGDEEAYKNWMSVFFERFNFDELTGVVINHSIYGIYSDNWFPVRIEGSGEIICFPYRDKQKTFYQFEVSGYRGIDIIYEPID